MYIIWAVQVWNISIFHSTVLTCLGTIKLVAVIWNSKKQLFALLACINLKAFIIAANSTWATADL